MWKGWWWYTYIVSGNGLMLLDLGVPSLRMTCIRSVPQFSSETWCVRDSAVLWNECCADWDDGV